MRSASVLVEMFCETVAKKSPPSLNKEKGGVLQPVFLVIG